MPDKYPSMRALYADPMNVEGTTYGKRWKRHKSIHSWKLKLLIILRLKELFSQFMVVALREERAKSL